MKQLTREEAIKIADSGIWKNWTNEEIVKFQLYQNRLCMDFSRFHEAVEKVLGRPVYTHEFGAEGHKGIVAEYEGTKEKPSFEEIIKLIPEEKRIIILA